jgi:ATP-dependent DNA helicase RecG
MTAAREALSRVDDDRRPLDGLGDLDLLRALGLVDDGGRLLRAGEVLFCESAADANPAVLYQYRPTPGGEATAVERLDSPLVLAFERAMTLVRARRNVTPLTLANGQQIEIADFPEIAVREALSNAVIHRDYRLGPPVHIEHSPSSFVTISPGPLVGSVTSENILTHASTPRNPALARAARMLRLAEETGKRTRIRAHRHPEHPHDTLRGRATVMRLFTHTTAKKRKRVAMSSEQGTVRRCV